jgi:hypothetical protein
MAFSTELLYGGVVPERRIGDPAYFLDSSDLRPAREEAKVWLQAARASASATGQTLPSGVIILDDGQEAFRYLASPTVSGPTTGQGVSGR